MLINGPILTFKFDRMFEQNWFADDNYSDLFLAKRLLGPAGFAREIAPFSLPPHALKTLASSPSDQRLEVIVLDQNSQSSVVIASSGNGITYGC